MFISGKRLLHVLVEWRYHRMRVLHRRLGGSSNRAHNVVLITKKEIDISSLELEATSSRAIKMSLEVRVGGKVKEIGTITHIHDRVCWKGNLTVVHWVLYPSSKRIEPWVIVSDVISST